MARKMVIVRDDGSQPSLLTEVLAANELQLQEQVKRNPDLLPVDEFEMEGPLLVIGRETTLPSGAVDLVALARSGELLIVEFKTGPQNTDFRAVLAQLIDYGSNLWRSSFDEFETNVPARYFAGSHCQDDRVRGKRTLREAAFAVWSDLTDDEWSSVVERISQQLTTGAFHYVLVAQRFTPTIQRAVEYLNGSMQAARFYAVEVVRFASAGLSAFESRTVIKPDGETGTRAAAIDETRFLEGIGDLPYREALERFFEFCRGQGLRLGWGTKGTSIRVQTVDRAAPLTIGWVFPAGGQGWSGLSEVNLGFDIGSAQQTPSMREALEEYVDAAAQIPGAVPVKPRSLRAFHFAPVSFIENRQQIQEIVVRLVERASGGN